MDQNPKQQVAEQLRSSSSVLVTVSTNPTVDQLASAMGLTLMLNALGKHTTAVFSGQIPNTMEFLHPDKTFDDTVDGLRDFIISLSKDKADKLRYKVEDNVVKIFITPYKARLSKSDLEFSQGDYNVDLVVALGVSKREELDAAITAHGRILHDASIITINNDTKPGNLGAVDWTDENASSLSEMLVSISEALQGGILDEAMSTCFLTGIVSATERFKNEHTTPKVMTMAAQLMAAGANQQLIATNLNLDTPAKDTKPDDSNDDDSDGGVLDLHPDDNPTPPVDTPVPQTQPKPDKPDDNDILSDIEKEFAESDRSEPAKEEEPEETKAEDPAIKELEDELSHDSTSTLTDIEQQVESLHNDDDKPSEPVDDTEDLLARISPAKTLDEDNTMQAPSMGGTFNATSNEALKAAELDKNSGLNREMLTHRVEPIDHSAENNPTAEQQPDNTDVDQVNQARMAVEQAVNSQFNPAGQALQSLNSQPMEPDETMQFNPQPPTQPQMPQQYQAPQPMNNQMFNIPQPQAPQQQPMQPAQYQQMPAQYQQPQQPMQQYQGVPPQATGQYFVPPQDPQQQGPPPMPPGSPPPMPPRQ